MHDKGNKCSFKLYTQLFPELLLVELKGEYISYYMLRNKGRQGTYFLFTTFALIKKE